MLLATSGGYYLGTQYPASSFFVDTSKTHSVHRDVVELLNQLHTVIRQPAATLDDVNDFLVESYGPCWGIPDGTCRE